MEARIIHVLMVLLGVSSSIMASLEGQCSAYIQGPSELTFSLISHRNQTGHWSVGVHLDHGAEAPTDDGAKPEEWTVDMRHATAICQDAETVHIEATLTAPRSHRRAPADYRTVPGTGHYKLHTQPMKWPQARRACEKEGAHLAIINSEGEAKALQTLFNEHESFEGASNVDIFFLGFHDMFEEGEYVTVFGKSLESTGFTRWSSGNPDNTGGSENCGSFYRVDAGLNDIMCNESNVFVCEMQL